MLACWMEVMNFKVNTHVNLKKSIGWNFHFIARSMFAILGNSDIDLLPYDL